MFEGYVVGEKTFNNPWPALDYAKEKSLHVEFEYHNDVFCNLKGLKVDQDFDYRSEYLRKLFKQPQNLYYSGGSDSQTIIELSENLNLKWESVITIMSAPSLDGEANDEYRPGIEYAKKNGHNLKIVNQDISQWEKIYSDKKFMYKNGGEINFRPDYVHFADYQTKANYISGQDKPIMIYHDGRWFTWLDNIKNTVFGGLPNVKHFFLNRDMPEIYIQDCRSLRDHYVSKNGLPTPGTIIERQLHDRKVLGTYKIKKETQTCINNKNCLAVKQLWKMGRADIITNWLQICNEHRDTHQYQIQWTDNFSYNPMLCWLIDIDSLESINTAEFHNMLFSKTK